VRNVIYPQQPFGSQADPGVGMMTTPNLNWGILGCARITRRGLIPGITASTSGSLVALASRDVATARAWAEEFGIPKAYGSYQELLDDPAIQAVYVPFPNELHKPWVLAAADAGKQVLCEKPLALNAGEAGEMVEHCRKRGVLLMEAFMWRHQTRNLELIKLVQTGAIGELRLIRSSFSYPIAPGDWRLDSARGGGALFDVGCYGVNTARLFAAGEPVRASAMAHQGDTGVDLSLTAQLEFPGGVMATIDCSFEQPFRCSYELVGSRGVIDVPDAYLPPSAGKPIAWLRTIGSGSDSSSSGDQVRMLEFEAVGQYAAMVDTFAQSVATGRLVPPAEDGLAQMKVLDRIIDAIGSTAVNR
jgi:D-xylose 1-dehydrogenase (NADP+, D-xylono-1,5-lactone-forming)